MLPRRAEDPDAAQPLPTVLPERSVQVVRRRSRNGPPAALPRRLRLHAQEELRLRVQATPGQRHCHLALQRRSNPQGQRCAQKAAIHQLTSKDQVTSHHISPFFSFFFRLNSLN